MPCGQRARHQIGRIQRVVAAAQSDVDIALFQVGQGVAEIKLRANGGIVLLQLLQGCLKRRRMCHAGGQGNVQIARGFGFQIVECLQGVGQRVAQAQTILRQGLPRIGGGEVAGGAVQQRRRSCCRVRARRRTPIAV